jgi:nitrate/nitrite transporter NarK
LLLLCGQQFFRAAAMIFFVTWFPTFLRETRGVSLMQSGVLTTCAGVAAMFGVVSGGYCSDWLLARTGSKRIARQGLAATGMTICAALIVASYFVHDVGTAIALISAGAFVACFGGVAGYTVAIDYGGQRVGVVFGAMNMTGAFGAMLFPVTVGWLVSATGTWNAALFAFAALMAVDAILWMLLNPRGRFLEAT